MKVPVGETRGFVITLNGKRKQTEKKAGGSRGWKRASLLFVTGNYLDALPESTSVYMRVLVSQNVETNAALFCMLDETLKRRLKKC